MNRLRGPCSVEFKVYSLIKGIWKVRALLAKHCKVGPIFSEFVPHAEDAAEGKEWFRVWGL